MLTDIFKEQKCALCGEIVTLANSKGICRDCQREEKIQEKRDTVNSYCKTCKNRCKQNELVIVVKCPRYEPNNKLSKVMEAYQKASKASKSDDPDPAMGILPTLSKAYKKKRKVRRRKS